MSRDVYNVRVESEWPLRSVRYEAWYLDAANHRLVSERLENEATIIYRATSVSPEDRARFIRTFDREIELTGSMTLKLWVSTSEGDDLDLFVVLRKSDAAGRGVPFYGYNGFNSDGVAKGWLRVSHRELDSARSRPGRPWHSHLRRQPVAPAEIVPVEIEILASSTLFEAGSSLSVDVLGHDADRYPIFRHARTMNRGTHTIHGGGQFDSHLLAPVVSPPAIGEEPGRDA